MTLSTTIKSIQDIMRKDDGIDGDAQRIGQLTWMLFLKVLDQREDEWHSQDSNYKSPIPERCRWRNWAAYKPEKTRKTVPQIGTSELIGFVETTLFPTLRNLPTSIVKPDDMAKVEHQSLSKVISLVFEDSRNYMRSGSLMLEVIGKLNEAIKFEDFKTRQNLGDIYEKILNDLRSAGNAGEFYTPRAITTFMVQMVNPRLRNREKVMDPACGTGGFLTATISHLHNQLSKNTTKQDEREIENSIVGIEKKQLPHLLCITNLLLHGIDVPSQVDCQNTLARPWGDWTLEEQVDCIITNPPFGGMEAKGSGDDYPEELRTRETADMFLVLIAGKLLREGGRGAIVLPDGFLFGEGVKNRIKEFFLEECNLHTIVRLPHGVFSPYTSIKTNLLFFTKGKPTEIIWYFDHPYPEGRKSYSKTKPIRLEEFSKEKEWWGREDNDFSERQENEYTWKLDFKTKKEKAKSQAKPYWDMAYELNSQVIEIEAQILDLQNLTIQGDDIKQLTLSIEQDSLADQIGKLDDHLKTLRLEARNAQIHGDKLYWPVYNLDLKNPNTQDEEEKDPKFLLENYKTLLSDIEETQELLKLELSSAFVFQSEDEKL